MEQGKKMSNDACEIIMLSSVRASLLLVKLKSLHI